MNAQNKQCTRCGLPQSEWPEKRWADPLCKVGRIAHDTHTLLEEVPATEKSIEEIVEEFRKYINAGIIYAEVREEYKPLDFEDEVIWLKRFIIQSQIQLLDHLIEKAEGEIWTKENCPISQMEYEIQGVEFMQGKAEGRNQALQTHIDHLKKSKAEYELLDNK